MRLTLERLKHYEPAFKTCAALILDSENLREVDVVASECEQLQYLSLRYNQIVSVKPLF